MVDISHAYAKYLHERQNERHPLQLATALVPPDLAQFIEGGPRVLEKAQKAIDYLFGEVQDQQGAHGEKIIHTASEVVLHAPLPQRRPHRLRRRQFRRPRRGDGEPRTPAPT